MRKKYASILFILFITLPVLKSAAQLYQVGHSQITYTDPARGGRSIQTEIYYPAATAGTGVPVAAGNFPVIVFGHGFVMTWDAYQNFWDDLVPKGYIIAFPRTEGNISPNHGDFGKDLAFLVAKLQSESSTNAASIFYNHITDKSAIMGHSMGGGSTFLAAAGNTSITTMITFAAANTTPSSITAARTVTVPALVFSGENDCVAPPAANQVPMYDSLLSACKTFVNIKGAAHCEFANTNFNCSFGQSTCSPQPTISGAEQKDVVSDFLNLWLAYYLKEDCSAMNYFNDSLSASARITYNQNCPGPVAPVITQSGSVLQSTPASTYQWYWNGTPVSGANSQTYTVSQSGNYYVEVTYANICPFQSNAIAITLTGIMANENIGSISIYPNPASDLVTISIHPSGDKDAVLSVVDVLGKCLVEKKISIQSGLTSTEKLDVSALPPGIYFVEVIAGGYKHVEKIVKK